MKKIELLVTPALRGKSVDLWEHEPVKNEDTGWYDSECEWVGRLDIAKKFGDIKKIKKITITMED